MTRVILIHGTMDRGSGFAKVRPHLGALDVVTYDRRGYGHARDQQPTALEEHIVDLLDQIGEAPAVLVGHSLGGDLALAAAARRPDLVHAVGAWEAPLPWLPWWPEESAGTQAVTRSLSPGDAGELFMRGVVGDDVWEGLPADTKAARRAEGGAMLVDVQAIQAGPPFEPSAVQAPVLTGRGGKSKSYHRRSAEWLVDNLADAELFEIAGATHGAHKSHPIEFAEFVRTAAARAKHPGGAT